MENVLDEISNLYMWSRNNSFQSDIPKIKNLETLKFLIKKFPRIINHTYIITEHYSNIKQNLLHISLTNPNLEIITHLVENYPELVTNDDKGKGIFFFVVKNKNVECVKYIFKKFPNLIMEKYGYENYYSIVTESHLYDKKVIGFLMQIVPDLFLQEIYKIVERSQNYTRRTYMSFEQDKKY